ncbi:MAG: hypothetical protein M3P30_04610 [Chloroflexota bacterium]|nr:hypothetical protein [Chloroflexota bacterium]
MVAGTAASVGLALANDRRLKPVFVEADAPSRPVVVSAGNSAFGAFTLARDNFARRFALATLIGVAVLMLAATLPAITAVASSLRAPASPPPSFGPPLELRAAAGVSGNWEQAYANAMPGAPAVGAALVAGAQEQRSWDVLIAMNSIAADRNAGADAASARSARSAAAPYSMSSPSGIEAGTAMRARITIYGCSGPGGGFCNHMASGGSAFEGAAACSENLQFGTRLTISGDPTGRVYECLDRGSLPATWIDVYFENTSDGIAWQSELGSTLAEIHIVN